MDLSMALTLVYQAIDTVNDLRPADDQIAKTPDVALTGENGRLDSLALATLVLAVERKVAEITGAEIALLDEAEFDPQFTRFATPTTLAALILEKLA